MIVAGLLRLFRPPSVARVALAGQKRSHEAFNESARSGGFDLT